MVHVDYLAIFPVVVVNRTHIGGRPADVTADLLRRRRRCSVGDNGQENPMRHFWGDGTTVLGVVPLDYRPKFCPTSTRFSLFC